MPFGRARILKILAALLFSCALVRGQNAPATAPAADEGRGGGRGGGGGAFSPVFGITVPAAGGGARGGRGGRGGGFGGGNMVTSLQNLRQQAVAEVGEEQADNLMQVWDSISYVERSLNTLNFGAMLRFGHVLARWIDRPMVPFPEELTPDEKKDWEPYLFQARTEQQALNLVDIQGMDMYQGWGAKMIFQRVIELDVPQMQSAINLVQGFEADAKDDASKHRWELFGKRLDAALCLLQSADHMVSYQAHLDRVRELHLKPDPNPPLGTGSDWARTDMMELARKEIDTMAHLRQLILSTKEPIIETSEEETIMALGPNIAEQIKDKIDTMNRHWRDYDRIFTGPNP
jgi:hypothetical protein